MLHLHIQIRQFSGSKILHIRTKSETMAALKKPNQLLVYCASTYAVLSILERLHVGMTTVPPGDIRIILTRVIFVTQKMKAQC